MKYRWMKPMYYQQSVCVSIVCSVWWMNRPPTHSHKHTDTVFELYCGELERSRFSV